MPRELLINAHGNKFIEDYYYFLVDTAILFGANVTKATPELLDILRFEMELAKVMLILHWRKGKNSTKKYLFYHFYHQISMTTAKRNDLSQIYNPMTIQELQTNYPYVNWLDFFNSNLQNLTRIDQNETVIVVDRNYLQRLGGLIESTPNRTLANYFAWRLVLFGSYLLNDVLDNQRRQHFNIPPMTPATRLTECVKKTTKL